MQLHSRLSTRPTSLGMKLLGRGPVPLRASSSGNAGAQTSRLRPRDPFVDAAYRLQSLLHAVGDGEQELLQQSLREEAPLSKLGLMAAGGGVITLSALLISSLAGQDPWGGASLSLSSLSAAAAGAALALPLVLFRAHLWSPAAAEELPALGDMHRLMGEEAEPWLCRFDHGHLAAHAALEVLPMTLLLLPAAQGGLCAGFQLYSELLREALFASPAAAAAAGAAASGAPAATPEGVGAAVACFLVASAAAYVQRLNLVGDEEEVDVVREAVQNADRYYRLTSMQVGSTADDAARASRAFKAVAVSWMEAREEASKLAGTIAFLDVAATSGIWYWTGDLTAAAVAALAVAAVDYHHLHQMAQRGGARRAGAKGAKPTKEMR